MYPYEQQFPTQTSRFGQTGGPPFGPPHGGGGQGQPPFNPHQGGGGQGQPPFNPHQGGGGQGQPPLGPPPSTIPPETQGVSTFAVDPGSIRGCLYRYTFVRLNNGRGFWFYPTFVGRTSVAGYRWRPRQYRWEYFGIDLNRIRSFSCR